MARQKRRRQLEQSKGELQTNKVPMESFITNINTLSIRMFLLERQCDEDAMYENDLSLAEQKVLAMEEEKRQLNEKYENEIAQMRAGIQKRRKRST
jgi:hypothetical protein